jgi:cytochrome P450
MNRTTIEDVDLASAAFKANPYPYYARLRAEAPVHRVELSDRRTGWLITRYDDVLSALKDPLLVKDRQNASAPGQPMKQPWMPGFVRPLTQNMLDRDPPDHTRLRALVHRAFTPRRVEQMSEWVQAIADESLRGVERKGSMEIIRDFALPLPTTIIAEMLGVPVEDRHRFHRWSSRIVASDPSGWRMVKAIPSLIAFLRYIRRLVRARQAEPRDDLVSALVQAEESGDQLNEDELVAMIFLLLVAGHETTVNLIGNGVLALLRHPQQMEELRRDPSLIEPAVEELLRYSGPLEMATERYAREDMSLQGVTIPRGGLVLGVLASANRDERQFDDPDLLNLTRKPNRHLAFGHGIHHCLGASLARLEGRVAINTLLQRLGGLRLAADPGSLRWRRGLVLRGLEALPVTFTRVH